MIYDPLSKDLKCRVFDIETTGLYSQKDCIISASFIDPDGSGLLQFFTEDPAAEHLTVSRILQELSSCDTVITYNGHTFDLPFVLTRARRYGLAEKLPMFRSADMYKWLKHYWQLAPSMPSLRQKAVEEALGLSTDRTDLIGGDECISLYSRYIALGEKQAKDLILLHNADDVRQLARICQKTSFLPYYRIAFEQGALIKICSQSLMGLQEYKILTGPAQLSKGKLSLTAKIDPPCMPTAYYEDHFVLQSDNDGSIRLDINTAQTGEIIYTDLKKLPAPAEAFSDLPAAANDYLVLSDKGEINYRECVTLAMELLKTLA